MFEGEEDISDMDRGRWIPGKGVRFIGDSPIFGCGPGALMDLYDTVYGDPNRPHNEFIEYAACIGIPNVL